MGNVNHGLGRREGICKCRINEEQKRESMAPSWLKYANLERMRWIDDVLSDKLDSLPFRPEITIIGFH